MQVPSVVSLFIRQGKISMMPHFKLLKVTSATPMQHNSNNSWVWHSLFETCQIWTLSRKQMRSLCFTHLKNKAAKFWRLRLEELSVFMTIWIQTSSPRYRLITSLRSSRLLFFKHMIWTIRIRNTTYRLRNTLVKLSFNYIRLSPQLTNKLIFQYKTRRDQRMVLSRFKQRRFQLHLAVRTRRFNSQVLSMTAVISSSSSGNSCLQVSTNQFTSPSLR